MKAQTPDELSETELDRIERRIDAAAPGPWISRIMGRDAYTESNCIEFGACNELGSFVSVELVGGSVADQDFIASARQDVPRLLLEVRTMRARLDSLVAERSLLPLKAGNRGIVDGPATPRSAPM